MDELQRDFESLRDEDRVFTPPFESVRAARPAGARTHRLVAGLAAAAVLALTGVWLTQRPGIDVQGADLAAALTSGPGAEWTSPTDFLLELPGSELLRTAPAVGASLRWNDSTSPTDGTVTDTARKGRERT